MKDRDLIKLLQQNGWKQVRINGSHHIMQKGKQTESIPVHGKGCSKRIIKCNIKENRA